MRQIAINSIKKHLPDTLSLYEKDKAANEIYETMRVIYLFDMDHVKTNY